jgi:hypothetical protein
VATLKGIGSKVKHAEHVAKTYAEDRIADAVGRLPGKAQTAVKHAFALGKAGTKALFATWIAGQNAAERISRAKGSTVEQARKLRGLLSGIDIAVMKPIQIALGATGLGHAALPASFVPPATAAYLAYSTARHPLATVRAAGAAVLEASRGAYTKLKKWSNPAPTGPYSAFARNTETLGGVESYLADTLEHYGYSDWFVALLSASLDLTGDLASALGLAQKAANHFPEDTSSLREDDAEKILGGSMVGNSNPDGCNQYTGSDCGGEKKPKLIAKHRKILAEIDRKMEEAVKEHLRTKDEVEKQAGFPIKAPTEVVWESLKKGTSSDLDHLVETGYLEKRNGSLGTMVRRKGIPHDYYFPGGPTDNSFCKTGEGGGIDPSCSPKSGKEKFIGAKVEKEVPGRRVESEDDDPVDEVAEEFGLTEEEKEVLRGIQG